MLTGFLNQLTQIGKNRSHTVQTLGAFLQNRIIHKLQWWMFVTLFDEMGAATVRGLRDGLLYCVNAASVQWLDILYKSLLHLSHTVLLQPSHLCCQKSSTP